MAVWEGKSSFLFHLDLFTELATHSLTLAHYVHIWCIHGLNFHLVSRTACPSSAWKISVHHRCSSRASIKLGSNM